MAQTDDLVRFIFENADIRGVVFSFWQVGFLGVPSPRAA